MEKVKQNITLPESTPQKRNVCRNMTIPSTDMRNINLNDENNGNSTLVENAIISRGFGNKILINLFTF